MARLPVQALLAISFIEGAAVMIIELLGAKVIAPVYGTSLYVWASVLGVTIGALALGYFAGGVISRRYPGPGSLFAVLAIGGVFTLSSSFTTPGILALTEASGVRWGSLLAVLLYLLPPVACMGAVSPIIVQLLNQSREQAGRWAGNVYAVSTVGGILATLLASFFFIPEVGIRLTSLATGGVLALVASSYFVFAKGNASVEPAQPQHGADEPQVEPQPGGRASQFLRMPSKNLLLTISFIEGGAVMVMELLGAKITAPHYGTSLYVWGSVLAVTLAALALGYFLGGVISRKYPGEKSLFLVLLVAAFLTAIAPLIGPAILRLTNPLGVQLGALASVLTYLLPPVTCMAMVSPLIIELINRHPEEAGRSTGTVYAISTVGGILATFIAGFYLIPGIGIEVTAFITAGVLGSIAVSYFAASRDRNAILAAIGLSAVVLLLQPARAEHDRIRVVFNSVGILGEWSVVDYGDLESKNNAPIERTLRLNGIDQTYTVVNHEPLSLWKYPHKIAAYSSMKPAGSRALLLGMGGGSIAFEMTVMELDLDIVELDERIEHIATEYFKYDPTKSNLYFDDARHFIRQAEERYDVVVIDLLLGEVQPAHVLTLEGFEDLKQILDEDAIVVVNFQGNIYDPVLSLGPRSVFKTLKAAGFEVEYFTPPKPPGEKPSPTDDIFFIASLKSMDYASMMQDLRYNDWYPFKDFVYEDLIRDEELDLTGAHVLVDDKPKLELLNAATILEWRKTKLEQMESLRTGAKPVDVSPAD